MRAHKTDSNAEAASHLSLMSVSSTTTQQQQQQQLRNNNNKLCPSTQTISTQSHQASRSHTHLFPHTPVHPITSPALIHHSHSRPLPHVLAHASLPQTCNNSYNSNNILAVATITNPPMRTRLTTLSLSYAAHVMYRRAQPMLCFDLKI